VSDIIKQLSPLIDAVVNADIRIDALEAIERTNDSSLLRDAQQYESGNVYRKGDVVQAHIGQFFTALRDTADGLGSAAWKRIGTSGFRFAGVKPEHYEIGDLYIDDGSLFLVLENGVKGKMIVQRGRAGATIKSALVDDDGLQITMTDGRVVHAPAPFFESYAKTLASIADEARNASIEAMTANELIAVHAEQINVLQKAVMQLEVTNDPEASLGSVPIRAYRGLFDLEGSYRVGDIAKVGRNMWLAIKTPIKGTIGEPEWVRFGGSSGGSSGSRPKAMSPFHVVASQAQIPTTGAGDGDTYFTFSDRILHIWNAQTGAWTTVSATAQVLPNELQATAGTYAPGAMRYAEDTRTLWVADSTGVMHRTTQRVVVVDDDAAKAALSTASYTEGQLLAQRDNNHLYRLDDTGRWEIVSGTLSVADAAERNAIDTRTIKEGQLCYQADTGMLWVLHQNAWIAAGGGGGGTNVVNDLADLLAASAPAGAGQPPTPAGPATEGDLYVRRDNNAVYIRNGQQATGTITDWTLVGSGTLLRVADEAALNALPDAGLAAGQLVYVDDLDGLGTFGLLRRNANARQNTIADFDQILPQTAAHPLVLVDRSADLPIAPSPDVTYIIRHDNAGNPLGRAYVWDANGGPLVGGQPSQPPLTGIPPGYLMSQSFTMTTQANGNIQIAFDMQGAQLQADVQLRIVLQEPAANVEFTIPLLAGSPIAAVQTAITQALSAHANGYTVVSPQAGIIEIDNAAGHGHATNVDAVIIEATGAGAEPPGFIPAIPATPAGEWIQADQRTYVKAAVAAQDETLPLRIGDLQVTTESNHAELKVWDGAAWQTVLTEDEIKTWIASGSLFRGTVNIVPQAGSDGLANLPVPDASNRGSYWTWVGPPNYVVHGGLTDSAANAITITVAPAPPLAADAPATVTVAIAGATAGTARDLTLHISLGTTPHAFTLQILAADDAAAVAGKIATAVNGQYGLTAVAAANAVTITPPAGGDIAAVSMVPDGQTPGIGVDLAGELLQVNDWVQSNGTNWTHISSDLLSKLRADRIFGLLPWQNGSWEQGSLVWYNQHIYRARSAVQSGDAAPSTPTQPVTISGSRLVGTLATIADVESWMRSNPATQGNAGDWIISTSAGNIATPGGATLTVAAGDAVLNTGDASYGTGGWANVGQVVLPPVVAAHAVQPVLDIGPISTQNSMNTLPAPSAANAGTWAALGAAVNAPIAAGGAPLPAGSTIMVLEDASQGTGGYSIVRATGGVAIVQNPSSLGNPTYPGTTATIGGGANLAQVINSALPGVGRWWAVTTGQLTAAMMDQAAPGWRTAPNAGNIASLLPLNLMDALVLADLNGPVWVKVPNGSNIASPATFVGAGGTNHQINSVVAPTPPAAVQVADRQPPPATAPSYTFTPVAGGTKWDEVELESGIISVNDDTELPRTPPDEATLIFVARSQRMNGNPAIYRWDQPTGDYIDIVARAEHPIAIYADVATMQASAPNLPYAIGFAIREGMWGRWTGPVQAGSRGVWSVDEYWSVIRGNMAWQARAYQLNAIVYWGATNSFYRATQAVPDTIPNPADPASAAYWQQIGGGGNGTSTRTFFGAGDFSAASIDQAHNWGMPTGTFPSGIQPQNGDAYFDQLTGTISEFMVVTNPPANHISGTFTKATATKIGDLSIGQVAGRVNLLTFNEDGSAQPINSYYEVNVPAATTVHSFSSGFNYLEWNTPLLYGAGLTSGTLGFTIKLTEPGGSSIPVGAIIGQGEGIAGRYWAENTLFVYTNIPWMNGRDGNGREVIDGWLVLPNGKAGNPGGHPFAPIARPTSGHLLGIDFTSGTKLVVWTGDNTADHGGWVVIDDHASFNWQLGTPNARPQPDTITVSTRYGWSRNFTVRLAGSLVTGNSIVLLQNITDDTQILRVEIRDIQSGGSAYEFDALITAGQTPLLSPIAAIATPSAFMSKIGIRRVAPNNNEIWAEITSGGSGKTLEINVSSHDEHLRPITAVQNSGQFTTPSGLSINATKNYPDTVELSNTLVATSTSADIQVPQQFTRSSVVKNAAETSFTLGIKPKRYLRAKFLARKAAGTSNQQSQFIMQRSGAWQNWAEAGRDILVDITNLSANGSVTLVTDGSWADDSTGLDVNVNPKPETLITTTVEITLFKEHSVIETECLFTDATNSNIRRVRTRFYAPSNWSDTINLVGFKCASQNHSFIEAYISWE
jgi:hypothetical protein